MSAFIKDAIRQLLITACMMWLFDTREARTSGDGERVTFFVYPGDLTWTDERMKNRRIKVKLELEEWNTERQQKGLHETILENPA